MRIRSLFFSATASLLASCTAYGACTLIGCENGLLVRFDRPPAGAFRVEAGGPGDAAPRVIDCADAASCHLVFRDLIADEVTVRVVTQQGTFAQQFQPEYESLHPNGRECGPACRQASVTFQLPD